jgi:solute carrier family 25 (adenine nucleotide translocator) protein 4/5/6/31
MPSDNVTAFLIDFTLGGVSGAVSKTATAPIERVKLLIQTQDANPRIMSGEVPRYTGIGNCFTRVTAEQGFASFWRGNGVNVIRYFPTQAFNLSFKDAIKKMFPKYSPKEDFWKFFAVNLASGGAAGAGSLTIVYPLDYARTRLASDVGSGKKQFNGLVDCLKKTASGPKGVMGIYNGFGVSVAGIIAYRGVQFGTFDTILGLNPYKNDRGIMGVVSTFGAAQTAVLASAGVTYPLDTIRRRLQMQSDLPMEKRIYTGTFQCAARIAKDEGVGALYKGFVANALRTVGAALVLVLYDTSKKHLNL